MSASIKVENRSEWPTWFVRWIVRKACADAGVTVYRFTMKGCSRNSSRSWGGRADCHGAGYAWCKRRALRSMHATWLFHYFHYKPENSCRDHIPHTTIALVAKIIRHEVEHQGGGHPREFRKADGSRDKWLMEMHCNEMAAKWVNSLDWWGEVYPEWKRLARAARPKKINRTEQTRNEHAMRLDQWTRKLKLAQTKVRKYRTLLRSADRRLAATSGSKR